MIRDRFPGEEEQLSIYRDILKTYEGRPVTLRTLDIGGDKCLSYFPIKEDNPFLGWRGIRVTLDHPEIFLVQIRAMLRASSGLNNLKIVLPMIATISELEEALVLFNRAYNEVLEEDASIVRPELGAMLEVPSLIFMMDAIAEKVDFFSVGTNDLTQYLLAVDRNNAQVAMLYDSMDPAVVNALVNIVKQAHKRGKKVSVCGEMAGDPAAALLLVGMGIDSLSMNAASLPRVKSVIRQFSAKEAKKALKKVRKMNSAQDIRTHMDELLETAGLGGLVCAGS